VEAWAIVVAGGSGSRFGSPKQYAELGGRPLLAWSVDQARRACHGVVLVVQPGDEDSRKWSADRVVAGGATRSASVRAGLAVVPDTAAAIVVHDAARPLARDSIWQAALDAVKRGADAAIPTVAVTDTIKQMQSDGRLLTLDRQRLVAVQTPQAFRASVLREAHKSGADATDDAALVEALGATVVAVEGSADNLKVTSPIDLVVAATLQREMSLR
jgi:2-C-methyl-D-erythritol 4-phosphate cytidylyltransferase